jgi:hypothetical protein
MSPPFAASLFLLMFSLLMASCRLSRPAESFGTWEEVTVEDSGWISGCGMTLRTVGGRILIPLNREESGLAFGPQDRWKIRYDVPADLVQACTLPGMAVRILEGRRLRSGRPDGTGGIKPAPRLCAWTIDAYSVPWMEWVIRQTDPNRITRYRWLDGGAYLFESDRGNYLFDCRGEWLCQHPAAIMDCTQDPELREAYVILVRNTQKPGE